MEHILIHLISAFVRWLTTSQKNEDEETTTYQGRPGAYPYTPPPPKPQYHPQTPPPIYQPNYQPQWDDTQGQPMSDVEDYLRRVRGQQQAPPPVRQPPPRAVSSMPIDVEILDDEPPTGRLVAQHVSQHLSNRQFEERAAHLADDVEQADEQMDQRLHQKFDHRLGRLAGQQTSQIAETNTDPHENPAVTAGAAPAASITASDIALLLRTPQSIRHALIMSEIMKPASERTEW